MLSDVLRVQSCPGVPGWGGDHGAQGVKLKSAHQGHHPRFKPGVNLCVTLQAQGCWEAGQGRASSSKGTARPSVSWLPHPRGHRARCHQPTLEQHSSLACRRTPWPATPPQAHRPTVRLPCFGEPVSGPDGPQAPGAEAAGSSPPPGARCWPSGRACRTSAHCSPRPVAAAWGTRTRLGPTELSPDRHTHPHEGPGPKLLVSQDGVSTHLQFTEKLQTQSESHGP